MLHPIFTLKRLIATISRMVRALTIEQSVLRQEYENIKQSISVKTPDNPALFGYKVYSQFDEDGIIAHIFSRIGEGGRIFVEIGCSDGLENNTHLLLLQGWRGVWVDADADKLRFVAKHLPPNSKLVLKHAFVSAENAGDIVLNALATLSVQAVDLLSVDIDGNDLHVLSALLDVLKPRLICVEYNAKFPPTTKIAITNQPGQFWTGDDYQGASLRSFIELLQIRGYNLIACGVSGVNAFFVQNDDFGQFPDHTAEQLFQPARYDLRRMTSGHPASLKFLADTLSSIDRPQA